MIEYRRETTYAIPRILFICPTLVKSKPDFIALTEGHVNVISPPPKGGCPLFVIYMSNQYGIVSYCPYLPRLTPLEKNQFFFCLLFSRNFFFPFKSKQKMILTFNSKP